MLVKVTTQAARPDLPAWIKGPHQFLADQKGRLQAGRLYLIRPTDTSRHRRPSIPATSTMLTCRTR